MAHFYIKKKVYKQEKKIERKKNKKLCDKVPRVETNKRLSITLDRNVHDQ